MEERISLGLKQYCFRMSTTAVFITNGNYFKKRMKSETRLNAFGNFKSLQGKLNSQNGSARDPSLTEKSVSAEKNPPDFFDSSKQRLGTCRKIARLIPHSMMRCRDLVTD